MRLELVSIAISNHVVADFEEKDEEKTTFIIFSTPFSHTKVQHQQ